MCRPLPLWVPFQEINLSGPSFSVVVAVDRARAADHRGPNRCALAALRLGPLATRGAIEMSPVFPRPVIRRGGWPAARPPEDGSGMRPRYARPRMGLGSGPPGRPPAGVT